MRTFHAFIAVLLFIPLALAGCGLFTSMPGGPDTATRVMAGLDCLSAVALTGAPVATDPTLGFSTALDVFNAISKITNAVMQASANQACKDTLNLVGKDAAGAVAMIGAQVKSTETPPQRKARLSTLAPKAQAGPVILQVPLH